MKSQMLIAAAAAVAALGAAGSASAAQVEIKNAVARVVVIPENRSDVKVEISPGSAALPRLEIRTAMDGKTIIDGGLDRKIRGCHSSGMEHHSADFLPTSPPENVVIQIRDQGDVKLKDAPLVTIRTPMAVSVHAGGAVFGAIGRSDSVDFANAGCGDWTIANTKGSLSISEAGSGDVRTGSAGDARIAIAGSGDVHLTSVGTLKASIAGSGDVTAESANGIVHADIAGSGDVKVKGGRVDRLEASIAGSGDVAVASAVADVSARIMGSGDVRVGAGSGHISKMVMGSGSVVVGN